MLSKQRQSVATLWLVDSRSVGDAGLAAGIAWLNTDELARYRRFVRPLRQRQFLIGRILLRQALSELLGVPPASLVLSERAGNAPLLHWPEPAPFFSLSHSGAWIACAVSPNTAVGLDIEVLDQARDFDALAAQAFDADELARLRQSGIEQRLVTFYELWSRKEALYKLRFNLAAAPSAESFSVFTHPELAIVIASAQPLASVAQMLDAHLNLLPQPIP